MIEHGLQRSRCRHVLRVVIADDGLILATSHKARRRHGRAECVDVGEHVPLLLKLAKISVARHRDRPCAARHNGEWSSLSLPAPVRQIGRAGVVNAADNPALGVEAGRGCDPVADSSKHVPRLTHRRQSAGVASVYCKRGKTALQRSPQVRMASQGSDFAGHHAAQAPGEELWQQQDMSGSLEDAGMRNLEKMELSSQVQTRGKVRRKGVLERIAYP